MVLETGGLIAGASAFILTLTGQWLLGPMARRFGMLDYPTERKNHLCPTPLTGGIAMLVGVLVAGALMVGNIGPAGYGFSLAAIVLIVVGSIDDKYDLSWRVRFPAQIVAALIMVCVGGARVDELGSLFGFGAVTLGVWAVPFTVFATVGIINAINMVDGLDGLAGMLVLSTLVMFEATALYTGNAMVAARVLILIGAVSAFLLYNLRFPWRRQAKVFMGNAGSAFLGLVIAWLAIRLTQNPSHPVGAVFALWLVPIPLMDCLVLMLRRTRDKKSPFAADHNHMHHLMLSAGFGPTRIAFMLAFASCVLGLLAALAMRMHVPHVVLLAGFVALCAGWYRLTSNRDRAIGFFVRIREWMLDVRSARDRAIELIPPPSESGQEV